MNISIDVRLDLSPAFAAAMQELTHALGARGLPPPRPCDQQLVAEKLAPAPSEAALPVDTLAEVEGDSEAADRRRERVILVGEREALLTRDYAAGVPRQELLRRLNALPGPPIDGKAMANAIFRRGLRRPAAESSVIADPPVNEQPAPEKPRSTWSPPPAPMPAPAPPVDAPPMQVARKLQGEAIVADDATIRHWASARGLCNGAEPIDMDRINAKRMQLGLGPYRRVNGLQASAGTLRSAQMGDAR